MNGLRSCAGDCIALGVRPCCCRLRILIALLYYFRSPISPRHFHRAARCPSFLVGLVSFLARNPIPLRNRINHCVLSACWLAIACTGSLEEGAKECAEQVLHNLRQPFLIFINNNFIKQLLHGKF